MSADFVQEVAALKVIACFTKLKEEIRKLWKKSFQRGERHSSAVSKQYGFAAHLGIAKHSY